MRRAPAERGRVFRSAKTATWRAQWVPKPRSRDRANASKYLFICGDWLKIRRARRSMGQAGRLSYPRPGEYGVNFDASVLRSREDVLDDIAVDVGQTEIAA